MPNFTIPNRTIYLRRGATWQYQWIYQNPDGTPVDITGWFASIELRSVPDGAIVLRADNGGGAAAGGLSITGPAGAVNASVNVSDVVPPGRYVYDVRLAAPSPSTFIVFLDGGNAIVEPEITKT